MLNNSLVAWTIVGLLTLFVLFGSGMRGVGCTGYGFMGFGMFFIWIPVLIFLILGTIWLSQQLQHNSKQRRR